MGITGQKKYVHSKPKQATYGVYLVYASVAFIYLNAILSLIANWESIRRLNPIPYIIVALLYLSLLWIAVKISSGRTWARNLFLLVFFINLIGAVDLVWSFSKNPLLASLEAIAMVLQLLAIFFLYQRPSNAWFKQENRGKSIRRKQQGALYLAELRQLGEKNGADLTKLDISSRSLALLFLESYPEWASYFVIEPWPEKDDPIDGEYYLIIKVPSPAPTSERELEIDTLGGEITIIFGQWTRRIDRDYPAIYFFTPYNLMEEEKWHRADRESVSRAKVLIDAIINEEAIFGYEFESGGGTTRSFTREEVAELEEYEINYTYSWRGSYDKRY